jgi:ABC-2 type transport system ATP-binding protein
MKQKLGLACALIHTPKVLFLDEPTNGVDPVSRRDFWRILYSLLREKVTIFVSTAYLDEAERCNRLGLMHEGKLFAVGSPDEVKTHLVGTLIELRTDDPRTAIRVLREALPDDNVGLFGDRIHVLTTEPERIDAQARAACAKASLELLSVRPIEPSLEDVFVSVLTRKTKEAPHGLPTQ